MEMKLHMKLSQQLVMTPQLVQAIRLLQLSRNDLIDEVRQELDQNPLLGDESQDMAKREMEARTLAENYGKPGEADVNASPTAGETAERIDRMDDVQLSSDMQARELDKQTQEFDWDQFLENRLLQPQNQSSRLSNDELPAVETNLCKAEDLQEHLMWQVQMSDFVENEQRFAALIIGNLDDRGYLDLSAVIGPGEQELRPRITLEDLAIEAGLNPEDAPEVLALIQRFDPIGVAARDLRECLRIQAEVAGFDAVELALIDRHLHNVERRNFQAIVKDLGVPMDEVIDAVQEIQKLESVPARNFSDVNEKQIAITPDVYIVKDGDQFVVTDNDRGLQRLFVNENLAQRLLRDPKAKDFVSEKLKSAQWLIRAIEQRRRTIIRVTESIAEKQREFLEQGVSKLRPMILRDVAEAVGMHESTISRVTSNKYVHTPQGLFELKYFFNSSIPKNASEEVASEAVKQAIRQLILAEDKDAPMSDQTIVEVLEKQQGIHIARRTVAKYREMLGILPSSKRKKMF